MISANGYTWAHKEKDVNYKNTSFVFAKNDIIIVSVNLNQSVITFKKQGNNDRFDLKFKKDLGNVQDEYHICACLLNNNDQIELLSPIKIDDREIIL